MQLVITSACDCNTRIKMGGTRLPEDSPVIGLLFGEIDLNKNHISLVDSADVSFERNTAATVQELPAAYVAKKVKLWTEVFPQFKLLGWYTFCAEVTEEQLTWHELIALQCESEHLLFLRFEDAAPSKTSDVVPITLYCCESVNQGRVFVETSYRIVSSEVENLCMQSLANFSPTQERSKLELENEKLQIALLILVRKIEQMIEVLRRMTIFGCSEPVHHKMLRMVGGICSALQSMPTGDYEINIRMQSQLLHLANALSAVTKVSFQASSMIEAGQIVFSDRSLGK
jgi:hypothetical protein